MDYFIRVTFLRGVMAERLGLIGSVDGFIGSLDTWELNESLLFLEQLEGWLITLSGE